MYIVGLEDIKQMQERHKKEVEELQTACPHKEISNWMEYHWAPGHYSHDVKCCNYCGKIVEESRHRFNTEAVKELQDGRCVVEV